MSQFWIYFLIGYVSFSLGIIIGCLIMMRGDDTPEEPETVNEKTETEPIKSKTDEVTNSLQSS